MVGRRQEVPGVGRLVGGERAVDHGVGEVHVGGGVDHGQVDPLGHAVAIAGDERGEGRLGHHGRRQLVDHQRSDQGRTGAVTLHVGDAHPGLDHRIEGRAVGQGPVGAVPGDVDPDQAGVVHRQLLVDHPEAGRHRRTPVADEDVGGVEQRAQGGPGLGGLQVEGDAALPPIGVDKHRSDAGLAAPEAAHRVALGRRLHLDDLRPEVAQHHGGERPADETAQLDDTDALERSAARLTGLLTIRHRSSPRPRPGCNTVCRWATCSWRMSSRARPNLSTGYA